MALVTDLLLSLPQAKKLLQTQDEGDLEIVLNALTGKARTFLNRVQLAENAVTAVTEWLRTHDPHVLWLHASPVKAATAITATVYNQDDVEDVYTLAANDLRVVSNNFSARLELFSGSWPTVEASPSHIVKVEYFAGWNPVPGEVLQGAIIQARVDLQRMHGAVGIQSYSRAGESIQYETEGLLKAVRDYWRPYKVLV